MTTVAPNHHPMQECLLAYANGCMGEAESLFIATHMAFCPECRKVAKIGECVGSKLMDNAAVPVSASCRDKLFAALDTAAPTPEPEKSGSASPECFIPEPLRGYLGGAGCRTGVQLLAWQKTGEGQRSYRLPLTPSCCHRGASADLISLEANQQLTLPFSAERRAILVLCGQLTETAGQETNQYAVGDVACAASPAAFKAGAAACFCLLVSLPPKGWLHKVLRLIRCG